MNSLKRIVAVAAFLGAALAAPAITAGEASSGDADARAQRRAREAVMRELEDQLRAAQLQMKDAARRLADLQVQLDAESQSSGRERTRAYAWRGTGGSGSASGSGTGGSWSTSWSGSWGNRAVLGVVVRTADDGSGGAEGAKLEAITPGGPAEQAGLKAGDVITSIQGVSLVRKSGEARVRARDDADEDTADGDTDIDEARRLYSSALLIREVSKLHDGDKVAIEYFRGGEKRTATVVAREIPSTFKMIGPLAQLAGPGTRIEINAIPAPEVPPTPVTPEALSSAALAAIAPLGSWSQMELVALNPDLGSYFSTDRGVLVVRAPRDGALKLKGGDVILQVDGEAAESPSSAMRLLRFGRASEPVQVLVLRKGQKLTVLTDPAAAPAAAPGPRPRRVAAPRAPAPPPPPPPKPGGAGNDL
ncbi:MAG: PDZ domain-containing protein [Acidobacteria bacterium]|nr:PDZ domain-containing protein [Acidobacteriota bacterium]